MLVVSTTSFAQYENANSGSVLVLESKSYTRIAAGYLMGHESWKYSGFDGADIATKEANKDIKNFNGFRFSVIEGIHLTRRIPLFLETGLNFDFGTRKYSDSESDHGFTYSWKQTDTYFAMAVPVNMTYKFIFRNGFHIAPYAGFNFKFNIIGKSTMKDEASYQGQTESESHSVNWFKSDEDNMGENGAYTRFQFGGQVGVNFGYKILNIGLGYQWDTPLYNYTVNGANRKLNTGYFNVMVGVNL